MAFTPAVIASVSARHEQDQSSADSEPDGRQRLGTLSEIAKRKEGRYALEMKRAPIEVCTYRINRDDGEGDT